MNVDNSTLRSKPTPAVEIRPVLMETAAETDVLNDRTSAMDLCDRLAQDFDTHLLLLANDLRNGKGRRNAVRLWKDDPGLSGELAFLFDFMRPDIVHTHKPGELAAMGHAARNAGVPHLVHSLCGELTAARPRQLDQFTAIAEELSPLLIAPSDEAADRLPSWARVEVVRTGIDCDRYAPGDKASARRKTGLPATPRIVGCASPAHGIESLLETIFHIDSEIHLALFGQGRPGPAERDLIRRLNLEERVHVLGAWAKPELIFQAIDIYFHGPSDDSLPRPVLAAQACGKPSIACAPALDDALCPQTGRQAPMQYMPTLRHSLRCALESADPKVTRRFILDNWNVEQSLKGYTRLFRKLTEPSQPATRLA